MPVSFSAKSLHLSGIIQKVDLVNRQLVVLDNLQRSSVEVPPGCEVLLRGEPVKLRILQPGDRIHVTFLPCAAALASRIEVQGNRPEPARN